MSGAQRRPFGIEAIKKLYRSEGARLYHGERVTQEQHALQCARLAEDEAGTLEAIAAALLHDIGHLISPVPNPGARGPHDDRHQISGLAYLSDFPAAVTEPIRLHVDAKRYLCRGAYQETLSAQSKRSLALQGGPFDDRSAERFLAEAFSSEALLLRRRDDRAKVVGLATPALEYYLEMVKGLCNP